MVRDWHQISTEISNMHDACGAAAISLDSVENALLAEGVLMGSPKDTHPVKIVTQGGSSFLSPKSVRVALWNMRDKRRLKAPGAVVYTGTFDGKTFVGVGKIVSTVVAERARRLGLDLEFLPLDEVCNEHR